MDTRLIGCLSSVSCLGGMRKFSYRHTGSSIVKTRRLRTLTDYIKTPAVKCIIASPSLSPSSTSTETKKKEKKRKETGKLFF